ncbi:hypothetical protein [Streptomyces sp. NRRL F-2747]|uniref:hypothetical protein n=1 Tax=Streptomyces sp. NRRL F-2747 TaxID=1463843 RepID=UPI001F1DFEDE|nr:hypothetical protein [Streptomyces sp. NRRL F-2747]
MSTAPGTKLGGHPGWCQDPEWPDCSGCGKPMHHLLTVESSEADSVSWLTWPPVEDRCVDYEGSGLRLGDLGGVYLFECRTCPGRPYEDRATGQYLGVFGLGAGLAEAAGPALIIFLCITWGRALTGLAAPSPSAGHGPGTPPGSRSTKTSRRSPPPRPEALG